VTVDEIAEALYSTYRDEAGAVDRDGKPIVEWRSFRSDPIFKKQHDAWLVATSKVVAMILSPKILKEEPTS
jgi:hypothetical protein